MEPFLSNFARMLAALALVLALAWIALRLLRGRLAGTAPRALGGSANAHSDALRFVRALPVGSKERVVLVEHRGERWLLGVAAGGISTIAHWPAHAAMAENAPAGGASHTEQP
jgi:flagellar protein FliO/FliZ